MLHYSGIMFGSLDLFQLDSDGDGQLSYEEFRVLFENAEKRRKETLKQAKLNKVWFVLLAFKCINCVYLCDL